MAVANASATVATTATLIVQNGSEERSLADWPARSYLLKNTTATATVFLGPSGVTTSNGFPWAAGDGPIAMDLEPGEALYGIVASGTQIITCLSQGR